MCPFRISRCCLYTPASSWERVRKWWTGSSSTMMNTEYRDRGEPWTLKVASLNTTSALERRQVRYDGTSSCPLLLRLFPSSGAAGIVCDFSLPLCPKHDVLQTFFHVTSQVGLYNSFHLLFCLLLRLFRFAVAGTFCGNHSPNNRIDFLINVYCHCKYCRWFLIKIVFIINMRITSCEY